MTGNIIKGVVIFLLLCVISTAAAVVIPSDSKIQANEGALTEKNLTHDVENAVLNVNNNVNATVFNLPKVYTLPMDLSPAPTPNPAGFTEDSYEDATISVKCWRERIELPEKTVTANFADVTIAHPTQLRMAFAGGSYGTRKRTYASKMAADNNAVIAINADFYNCRTNGLIIRQGTLYRKKCSGFDTLFIDSNGDFTVMNDFYSINSGFLSENTIYQAINFGPVIVQDGQAVKKLKDFNSVACGPRANNPRTAIGQLGKLHYLICAIDGRSDISSGTTTNELAVIMADKGCQVAYNLDGGQSTTMVFHNRLYNVVSDGGERNMSDILYFASAIPESEWNA